MISTVSRFSLDAHWHRPFFGGSIGFNEHGAFVIDAFTTPPADHRGSFFTALAISPARYREKHHTEAGYRRGDKLLTIYDDWGTPHVIRGPKKFLDDIESDCIKGNLLRK